MRRRSSEEGEGTVKEEKEQLRRRRSSDRGEGAVKEEKKQ